MKCHVFWHFWPTKNLNCGVFQTNFFVELETLRIALFGVRLFSRQVPGSRLIVVKQMSMIFFAFEVKLWYYVLSPTINTSKNINQQSYLKVSLTKNSFIRFFSELFDGASALLMSHCCHFSWKYWAFYAEFKRIFTFAFHINLLGLLEATDLMFFHKSSVATSILILIAMSFDHGSFRQLDKVRQHSNANEILVLKHICFQENE